MNVQKEDAADNIRHEANDESLKREIRTEVRSIPDVPTGPKCIS